MTHAASAPISQADRFSPAAMALALVLHVATGLALWWISPLRPLIPTDEAIEVTIDRGGAAPAEQQQPPPQQEAPAASPPAEPAPPQALAMPPVPQPPPPEPPPPERQMEQAVPPPPEPTPPPSPRDFPVPAPPPPPPPRPQPPAQAQRPPPPAPTPAPADQAAAAPQPSPLRNPSDVLVGPGGGGQTEYFTLLARQLARFRFYPRSARDNHEEGRVVVRIVIARDGKLVDARVERSSGWPAIDSAELETVRKAAPFPPLPFNIPGERSTFLVPVNYELRDPRGERR